MAESDGPDDNLDELAKKSWRAVRRGDVDKVVMTTKDGAEIEISVKHVRKKWKSVIAFLSYLKDLIKLWGG